jgi:hypothetical protein
MIVNLYVFWNGQRVNVRTDKNFRYDRWYTEKDVYSVAVDFGDFIVATNDGVKSDCFRVFVPSVSRTIAFDLNDLLRACHKMATGEIVYRLYRPSLNYVSQPESQGFLCEGHVVAQ